MKPLLQYHAMPLGDHQGDPATLLELPAPAASRRRSGPGCWSILRYFNGLFLTPSWRPNGVYVIGYGRVLSWEEVEKSPGLEWTIEQAEADMLERLAPVEAGVDQLVTVPLNRYEFDALVSFASDLGLGPFACSTVLSLLNAGLHREAAEQIPRWNRTDCNVGKGLTARRRAEARLFLTPPQHPLPMLPDLKDWAYRDPTKPVYASRPAMALKARALDALYDQPPS
ncbi:MULTISPECIES: lysozyme [unclassified Azospirillum]|uniref:lysozyme n=1 Tax=unclassified Azospirillum TaxID=2630922 RepID=UPI000D656C22|nr:MULTISPECIES: lysozyme [unclassified Azospirillum]